MDLVEIGSIVERHTGRHGNLIAILEEVQAKYGYLPEEALRAVAEKTGRSLVDVYGVATFYNAFSLKPRGKHVVSACLGTACHVQGGPRIVEAISAQLGIRQGETTDDEEFSLEVVNCLGACALGPVVVVDGHYFSKVKTSQVAGILAEARDGFGQVEIETDQRIFPVEVSCARCNHSLMDLRQPVDGHPSIRVTVAFNNKHGWLCLSCLYGSDKVESEFEIPVDTVVDMFCPHCHAELIGGGKCGECGEQMVPMIVSGGGIVQICTRRGCKGHMLDLSGSPLD
ncbi:NAD(P)H-dependent oxidoreductase subunit E [bacterium]|nr:NAD(P)H-dependent oxidoreductase subunit E [bacterium]MBU1071939.1 NAD(P)H-dependent oxidoreductase subunit E [bacterium]MBU1674885.1 NAD(P)H-dependent oxidoreductase subunit E [bacterium]